MTDKNQKKEKGVVLTKAYHDYAKGMRSYSSFKTSDSATGDDLVQDTFIKTWKYLVKGGKINLMRAFLYHVLNQLIIDEYRKHKTASLDELIEKGFEPSITTSERIFDIFDGKIALLLIKELPEKYQRVLRMRYIQDLSLEEISLITKQSKNATAVQIHRGLEKLKKLYNRT
ncbi:MAG: RNA polymerase sigma factor [Candidatus Yonathbacteria bacterium]|nr:RNA polymerase sigma factor [Candidatus Yonathbacteria bacterium]NTW47580.1 RNA polymerase sigma factor [Candidatus Yonathbacteria bacterium]